MGQTLSQQRKKKGQVDVMVLLHNLTQLLAQERNKLPDGMEDQVCWYYKQFEFMLGFLTDNEEIVDEEDLAKEIVELGHRTENVVETHYRRYKMAVQDEQPFILQMDHTRNLKKDIKGIIERIEGLMFGSNSICCRFQYGSRREKVIQMLNQSLPRTTMGWVVDPEADSIVDNTQYCDILVDRLINGRPPDERDFITIKGAMESGMINLVKKIYNDALVSDHFDSRAWLLYGDELNQKNLLLSILKDIMVIIPKEIYEMEEWELKKEVLKQLINSRYLIVLESKDHFKTLSDKNIRERNSLLRDVLPKNKRGSRIILATDNEGEAYTFGDEYFSEFDLGTLSYRESRKCNLFTLRDLEKEDYWKVFCKKIFGEKECPQELEHLGRRILEHCKSRYNIIVKIACILRLGEKTVSRWSNIIAKIEEWSHKSESFFVELNDVLIVSYDEMPQHLKPCFLYFTMFPSENEIPVKQLIQLWIAEGLIQWGAEKENTPNNTTNKQSQSQTIEDVAEKEYLEGPIGLSFIQVKSIRSDGGPKSCLIRQSEWTIYHHLRLKENFAHFYPATWWEGQPWRLCIQDCLQQLLWVTRSSMCDVDFSDDVSSIYRMMGLSNIDDHRTHIDRKLSLSSIEDLDSNDCIPAIDRKLSFSSIEELDSNDRIPDTDHTPWYIQYMDCSKESLPYIHGKPWLSNIDHLDSSEKSDIIESEFELRMRSIFGRIRTLFCIDEDTKIVSEEDWESFFKYTRLLIRVVNFGEVEVGKLPKAIEKLFHLRYLSLKPANNTAVPKSIFNLWNLQTIDLRTIRFSELPEGIWKMQQLRHLYLSGDGSSRLPIPESEECTLPNLQTLSFISIDPDDDIHISKRAPNLRKLGSYGYQCFSINEQEMTFNLPHLQTLKFAGECNFEVPITLPDTITKISTMKGVHLQLNVIEMFGKLPNLHVLKLLQTSFDDGELVFGEGSFPQLQLLKFEASNIVTWRLEDGTMPNLHRLIINGCFQLTEPPVELWKVNTLQELDLSRASMKFAKKVRDYLKKNEGLKLVVKLPLSSKSNA